MLSKLQCLADALVINFKIKVLSLDCTKLNDEAIACLVKSLNLNRILRDLHLVIECSEIEDDTLIYTEKKIRGTIYPCPV